MAYDKVIDSSVLDANLKSVADAIRTKGGTSANLAFPTGFVTAVQNIKLNMEVYDITIASGLGSLAGANSHITLLSGNQTVKEKYNKERFAAILTPVTQIAGGNRIMHSIIHGNYNFGATGAVRYGYSYQSSSATSLGTINMTAKLAGSGYNISLRATSAGNLTLYCASDRAVEAGSYKLILLDWSD